jgi:hypothetical protein
MVFAGLILLGTFFLPWSVAGDKMVFSWQAMRGHGGLQGFWPIVLLAGGFIAIVTSRTRLPAFLRVIGCTLAGLAPIAFVALFARDTVAGISMPMGWRVPTAIAGLFVCATGFLHRSVHDGLFPKMICTVGAAAFLASFLLPESGRFLFVEVVEAARDSAGRARVAPIAILAAGVMSTLALVTWKPGFVGAWTAACAWGLLLVLPVILVATTSAPWNQPSASIYPGANLFALSLLSTHGLAAIFARITA